MAFSPNGERIVSGSGSSDQNVSGSSDRTVRIWGGRTGAPIGKPLAGS
ncbi:MAG: hypothetical protein HC770_07765 [Pseudanabaena sp. CRU_2_10]|nr:hypothetical protein [Pseudanabaena sp. CRU_2_10]